MAYRAFFDTNVLAYEFDRSDPQRQATAERLLDEWRPSGRMVISTQVLQELYVVLTMKLRPQLEEEEAERLIRQYSGLDVVIVDPDLIVEGIRIRRGHRLSFWDALIVAAASEGRCRYLFTEDLSHGMRIEGVEIVNPFR